MYFFYFKTNTETYAMYMQNLELVWSSFFGIFMDFSCMPKYFFVQITKIAWNFIHTYVHVCVINTHTHTHECVCFECNMNCNKYGQQMSAKKSNKGVCCIEEDIIRNKNSHIRNTFPMKSHEINQFLSFLFQKKM